MKLSSAHIDPPFKNAQEALIFAFNFSHQQYPRSPMSRAIFQSKGGRGLGGLEGAAQAGMIKQEVSLLKPIESNYIIARYEPIGSRVWVKAMGGLSVHVRNNVLPRCQTTTSMRMDYIMRFLPYCRHISINELAKKHAISEKTAVNHIKEVKKLFRGSAVNNNRHAGLEERAMTAIADRLEKAGITGENE